MLAGCGHTKQPIPVDHPPGQHTTQQSGGDTGGGIGDLKAAAVSLTRYASCDEALQSLKNAQAAARAAQPQQHVPAPGQSFAAAGPGAPVGGAAVPSGGAMKADGESTPPTTPDHSRTNIAEPGVDEPDTVKTDGNRIVTVDRGTVYVVSTSDKAIKGSVALTTVTTPQYSYSPMQATGNDQLLLSGDTVLAISRTPYHLFDMRPQQPNMPNAPGTYPGYPYGAQQTELSLIDISGSTPKISSRFAITGDYVDARMVGTTVRVVTRSAPMIEPQGPAGDWMPHYSLQSHLGGGAPASTSDGTVDCATLTHPAVYSGTSMLTLLTFDLAHAQAAGGSLGTGDPVSVVADGGTVYSNGPSLYVANDLHQWQNVKLMAPGAMAVEGGSPQAFAMPEPRTELFKFDISGSAAPKLVASGRVPGWLLNQYSMSEYQGKLRVATTDGVMEGHADSTSSSAVYVLESRGDTLVPIGSVTGLGQGEKIYSVRFAGPVGYVVTFRQMDPLFTIDLRDPAHPRQVGKLELTGYSAYLHPVDDKTLIGLGQASTDTGRRLGTQVSLFDVSDPSAPRLAARYEIPAAHSGAEYDPHAFLYWPKTGMLVVPLTAPGADYGPGKTGALVLHVGGGQIIEVGFVEHTGRPSSDSFGSTSAVHQITRSLVADDTLWTVSDAGLLASDGETLADMGWIPYP